MPLQSSVVISVDPGTGAVEKTYDLFETVGDVSIYRSADHVEQKFVDILTCKRTFPKANGPFYGQAKGSAKMTQTVAVQGSDGSTITGPKTVMLCETNSSIPIGVSEEDVKLFLFQHAKYIMTEDFRKLVMKQTLA